MKIKRRTAWIGLFIIFVPAMAIVAMALIAAAGAY